jgi:aminopeptidase N
MMLEGDIGPAAMLDLAVRTLALEADELVAQQVLGDAADLFWRYIPPSVRSEVAPELETMLWDRMQGVQGASAKAAYFDTWRSVATTPGAVQRMRRLWSGDLEVEGLPLSEQDRTVLALDLAVRDVPDWKAILDRQERAIENPDRRERFAFLRPAVDADPAVRDSFFAALAEPANRSREEWVVTALGYLHHPLRAEEAVRWIRPGLDLLRQVHDTGDIFFPTRWVAATLSGHASPAAAAIVRGFIREHPDYPPRLMGKLLQQADPLFRAVALRR